MFVFLPTLATRFYYSNLGTSLQQNRLGASPAADHVFWASHFPGCWVLLIYVAFRSWHHDANQRFNSPIVFWWDRAPTRSRYIYIYVFFSGFTHTYFESDIKAQKQVEQVWTMSRLFVWHLKSYVSTLKFDVPNNGFKDCILVTGPRRLRQTLNCRRTWALWNQHTSCKTQLGVPPSISVRKSWTFNEIHIRYPLA